MLGQYGQMSDHYTRVHDENKHIGDSNSIDQQRFAFKISPSGAGYDLRRGLEVSKDFLKKAKKKSSPGEQGGGGQVQHRVVGRGGRQQHRRPRQLLSTVVPTGGSWGAFVFLSSVFQVAFSAPRAPYQV